ncbi:hypothetical protein MOO44_08415 [Nicoliella spurrieriana]|uniref:Cyclic lactone autoinducer peptide n=1 Tax=Nicoliella spurrieriana TaxID=2925830 RepID=A0A976RS75_9LACO|nr:hypothetical protein [Nicoliella spurrieriana]UQS86872.1 hypothetical protein MOO44_08415 [Nicoliella spurrieriana]
MKKDTKATVGLFKTIKNIFSKMIMTAAVTSVGEFASRSFYEANNAAQGVNPEERMVTGK